MGTVAGEMTSVGLCQQVLFPIFPSLLNHPSFLFVNWGKFSQEQCSAEPETVCNGPSCALFGANAVFTNEKKRGPGKWTQRDIDDLVVTGPATCPGEIWGVTDLKMIVLI